MSTLHPQAVLALYKKHFDAVVMDLDVPVLDGITAISIVRSLERNLTRPRQLIVGTSDNVQLEADGHAAGMDHFALKFDVMDVVRMVSFLFEGGKLKVAVNARINESAERKKYHFGERSKRKHLQFNEVVRVRTILTSASKKGLWWSTKDFRSFLAKVLERGESKTLPFAA